MGEVGWTIKTHQRRILPSHVLHFAEIQRIITHRFLSCHPHRGPCRSKAHGLMTQQRPQGLETLLRSQSPPAFQLPSFAASAQQTALSGSLLGTDLNTTASVLISWGHRWRMSSGLLRQLVLPWARSGGELEHGRQRVAARGGWITSACWDDVHAYLVLNN